MEVQEMAGCMNKMESFQSTAIYTEQTTFPTPLHKHLVGCYTAPCSASEGHCLSLQGKLSGRNV